MLARPGLGVALLSSKRLELDKRPWPPPGIKRRPPHAPRIWRGTILQPSTPSDQSPPASGDDLERELNETWQPVYRRLNKQHRQEIYRQIYRRYHRQRRRQAWQAFWFDRLGMRPLVMINLPRPASLAFIHGLCALTLLGFLPTHPLSIPTAYGLAGVTLVLGLSVGRFSRQKG